MKDMEHEIDILLATFNGADYIRPQLDSILEQTFKKWRLLIHDDGSRDGTADIVREYVIKDSRILMIEDNIKTIGAAKNFIHLLRFSTSELIIFCDQDDIWFENKLEEFVEKYRKIDTIGSPVAIFGGGYTFSESRGVLAKKIHTARPTTLRQQLFLNAGLQGCSLMFNRILKEKLTPIPDYIAMHDHLITLGALTFGSIYYLDHALMYYRQEHQGKTTSNIQTSIIKRLFSVFDSRLGVVDKNHFRATHSFYETFKAWLSAEQVSLFQAYFDFCSDITPVRRVQILVNNNFTIYNSRLALILKTIMRPPLT